MVAPQAPPAQSNISRELRSHLDRLQQLLDQSRADEALKLATGRGSGSPLDVNARAVCLMRIGRPEEAVKILRNIVLEGSSPYLKASAPVVFKSNFVTALALSGNPVGAYRALEDLREVAHPRLAELRLAIAQWVKTLSVWERVQWTCGIELNKPVLLSFPPGELT